MEDKENEKKILVQEKIQVNMNFSTYSLEDNNSK